MQEDSELVENGNEQEYEEQPFSDDEGACDAEESLQRMRSNWQFAAILQFCRIFAAKLQIKSFSADILEKALLSPWDYQVFFAELLYKLLRYNSKQPYKEEDSHVWEKLLNKKVAYKYYDLFPQNPLARKGFFELSPCKRVGILYALCEWRIHDCSSLKETVRLMVDHPDYTADALRRRPIGVDYKGSRYFFFSSEYEDCRLYREDPPKQVVMRKGKKVYVDMEEGEGETTWHTQATTLEELQRFAASFKGSKHRGEKLLSDKLFRDIIPGLIETELTRRKAEEKQAYLESLPKKRSSRIQDMAKKREEEEKQARLREDEEKRVAEERQKQKDRRKREKELRMRYGEAANKLNFLLDHETPTFLSRDERMKLRQLKHGYDGDGPGHSSSCPEEHPSTPEVSRPSTVAPTRGTATSRGPMTGRKREHEPGWTPLGPNTIPSCHRKRTRRKPQTDWDMLEDVAYGIFREGGPKQPKDESETSSPEATPTPSSRGAGGSQEHTSPHPRRPSSSGGGGKTGVGEAQGVSALNRALSLMTPEQRTVFMQRQHALQMYQAASGTNPQIYQQAVLLHQQQMQFISKILQQQQVDRQGGGEGALQKGPHHHPRAPSQMGLLPELSAAPSTSSTHRALLANQAPFHNSSPIGPTPTPARPDLATQQQQQQRRLLQAALAKLTPEQHAQLAQLPLPQRQQVLAQLMHNQLAAPAHDKAPLAPPQHQYPPRPPQMSLQGRPLPMGYHMPQPGNAHQNRLSQGGAPPGLSPPLYPGMAHLSSTGPSLPVPQSMYPLQANQPGPTMANMYNMMNPHLTNTASNAHGLSTGGQIPHGPMAGQGLTDGRLDLSYLMKLHSSGQPGLGMTGNPGPSQMPVGRGYAGPSSQQG